MKKAALSISLALFYYCACIAQPYLNKPYVWLDTGHAPTSIIVENDGYVVASWGFTEEGIANGGLFYRWGIIIQKINFLGDMLWRSIYNKPGKAYSIGNYGSLVRTTGGYLLCGDELDTITGVDNFFLAKFDTFGNKIWLKIYRRGGTQNCWHGQATGDGGYIMAGEEIRNGDRNYYVLKADSNGNKQWDAVYGGGQNDIGRIVWPLENDHYLISGTSKSYGPAQYDLWFFETDSIGNIVWEKTFGTPGDDRFRYITLSKDGGYIGWGTLDTLIYNTEARYAASVMKFDENRHIQWRTFFHHEKRRIIWQLRELEDGNIVAIGEQQFGLYDSSAGWIAKLNAKGDVLWERFILSNFHLTDSLFSVASRFTGDFRQTPDGGFVIAGIVFRGSETYPNMGNWNQLWLVKLDSNGCLGPNNCGLDVGIQPTEAKALYEFQTVVYPNPASETANIYIKGNSARWAGKQVQITLYNLTGQQLHTQSRTLNYAGYTETQLPIGNLAAGVYIYEITGEGKQLSSGKLVVE